MSVKRKWILRGCVLGMTVLVIGGILRIQQEKAYALAVQSVLINLSIAQEAYYEEHGSFTPDWISLLPQLSLSVAFSMHITPVDGQANTYWIYLQENQSKLARYQVFSSINNSSHEATLTASRFDEKIYRYQLQYKIPQQETTCQSAWAMKWFCRRITTRIKSLDMQHLIPLTK